MKAVRIFVRSVRDALKSSIRNFSLSFASIMCTTVTLILVAVAIVCAANVEKATKSIEDEMSIVVYLNQNVTEEQIKNVEIDIKSRSMVTDVIFKSKDEWKMELAKYSTTFETAFNFIGENPLMDSFTVKVDDIKKLSDTAKYIETIDGVETVKYGEEMVETIITIFDVLQKVVLVIVVCLLVVTAFLITNTIKLTILNRQSEIQIMRLVGANNATIKLPFIIEGLIIGIIGSIIPICVTIYGYVILYSRLEGHLFTNMLQLIKPYNFVFAVSFALVIIGGLVGMYGSLRAVKKHLKI